ncbi:MULTISPECIES: response regulator transcription factor [unclassified Imperialibacter]|uniref:response regulator n=1 Tax=unclassified Imperialibacter TaxID=2629706 RepID=UPI001259C9F5|nr:MULTISPECIES: response regulator transcription factor [unclassified Imperialibacter]CAD5264547.1 Oxygen regulatory protein NreC [Imperialibacter sp. 89]CAD5269454.1 Oxygen regulatory protein NreC [Imperialibacter sp. 75]VVT09077.1 Oxygen regulatory protein NreC [Imperialibacter sp. EC-SDR9]
MPAIRVVLADDHEIVRNGIKILLESEGDLEVVGEASDGQEALDKCKSKQPDILIVDINMPKMNGIETIRQLKAYSPSTKALVLSMHEDEEYILQSVEMGATGYLLKGSNKQEFLKAIHTVQKGEKYFTGDISNILVQHYLNLRNKTAATPTPQETGDNALTKREKEILSLIYKGESNKDIAEKLDKSVRTIETHRFNIMKKLDANNLAELLRKIDGDTSLKQALELNQ